MALTMDIKTCAEEFVGITRHCLANQLGRQTSPGRFGVDKAQIVSMLNHNKYEKADMKLDTWKALEWIEADPKYHTKHVYVRDEKTHRRLIVIKISIYEKLAELCK